MGNPSKLVSVSLSLMTAIVVAAAEAPPTETLVRRAIDAAGGRRTFAEMGVLKIVLDEQENRLDGTTSSSKSVCFVDTRSLENLRMEMSGDVVVVRNGDEGWAELQGELDTRPQTPTMAVGTVNQKLLPLLLPFALSLDGVNALAAVESEFQGTPSWRMAVKWPRDFFTSPSMNTTWYLEIARSDGRLLAAEFHPPLEIAKVRDEGVRYQVLRSTKIGGVTLPVEVLMDGIDRSGNPTGHARISKLEISVRGAFEPALFMRPDRLEAIEEGMSP